MQGLFSCCLFADDVCRRDTVTDLMCNRVLITHFPSRSLEEDPVHVRPSDTTLHCRCRSVLAAYSAAAITPGRAEETVFDSYTLG